MGPKRRPRNEVSQSDILTLLSGYHCNSSILYFGFHRECPKQDLKSGHHSVRGREGVTPLSGLIMGDRIGDSAIICPRPCVVWRNTDSRPFVLLILPHFIAFQRFVLQEERGGDQILSSDCKIVFGAHFMSQS